MLTCDQIQQHIDALDAQVPKQDADLLIWHERDSPDCEIIANRIGCLRFGIEMLKTAIVEADLRKVGTHISVKYMEVPRWSLHVKQITRSEDAGAFLPSRWRQQSGSLATQHDRRIDAGRTARREVSCEKCYHHHHRKACRVCNEIQCADSI